MCPNFNLSIGGPCGFYTHWFKGKHYRPFGLRGKEERVEGSRVELTENNGDSRNIF